MTATRAHIVRSGPFGVDATKWLGPISFFARGEPLSQPRPRAMAMPLPPGTPGRKCRCGQTWTARVYQPDDDDDAGHRSANGWKDLIALSSRHAKPRQPLDGPIALSLSFYYTAPKYVLDWGIPLPILKPTKPDADNIWKPVADALTPEGWWHDDGQIAWPLTPKWWVGPDQAEGVLVEVWHLAQPEQRAPRLIG